jgi:hypothetical protein
LQLSAEDNNNKVLANSVIINEIRLIFSTKNLVLTNVPGDGNCLFHCLSCLLKRCGIELSYDMIRQQICQYLRKNRNKQINKRDAMTYVGLYTKLYQMEDVWVEKYRNLSFTKYCDQMALNGEYGDTFCILAASDLYNVQIYAYARSTQWCMHSFPDIDDSTTANVSRPEFYLANINQIHWMYGECVR